MKQIRPVQISPTALDTMMPMHLLLNHRGEILHIGPTMRKVLRHERFSGKHFLDLFELRRTSYEALRARLLHGGTGKVVMRLKDEYRTQFIGSAVLLEDHGNVLVNLSFGISIFEAVADYRLAGSDFAPTDLTLELLYIAESNAAAMAESRALNDRLRGAKTRAEADAVTDTLTGLRNRRALDEMLRRLILRGVRFTLAHVDLDYFKAVNDTHGHAAGDRVLEGVAHILLEETRSDDLVARVGGDEFVLVIQGLTDRDRLALMAQRIIDRLEEPMIFDGHDCRISASIGMVTSEDYRDLDTDRMLEDADRALYGAKGAGRAQFAFHRPIPKAV